MGDETLKSSGEGGNCVVFLNSVCSDRNGKRIIKAQPNCEEIYLLMLNFAVHFQWDRKYIYWVVLMSE